MSTWTHYALGIPISSMRPVRKLEDLNFTPRCVGAAQTHGGTDTVADAIWAS